MLGTLTKEWAPHAFHVSFKLETDMNLVVSKAKTAIEKYGVHLVVANQLQTRKNVVYLVSRHLQLTITSGNSSSSGTGGNRNNLGVSTSGKELISYVNSIGASDSGKADLSSMISDVDNYAVEEIHRPDQEELIEPVLVEAVRQAHRVFVRNMKAIRSKNTSSSSSSSSSTSLSAGDFSIGSSSGGSSSGSGGSMIDDDCFTPTITSPTLPARFIKTHVDRFNQRGGSSHNHSKDSKNNHGNHSETGYGLNINDSSGKKYKSVDGNDDADLDNPSPSSMEITVDVPRLLVGIGFVTVVAFMIGRISLSHR